MKVSNYSFDQLKELLYSAVISDVLDEYGFRNQTLDPGLMPLDESIVLLGRAFTVIASEVAQIPDEPYKLQMQATDEVKAGEVFVVQASSSTKAAFWGELLSTACRARGGQGALIDGLCRDTRKIREMEFPVFSRGVRPVDSKGRLDVVFYQVPVLISGVTINPGDLIFGDCDGVVVIPQEHEDRIIAGSIAKASGENQVRKALQEGMLCTEAFKTFGIL